MKKLMAFQVTFIFFVHLGSEEESKEIRDFKMSTFVVVDQWKAAGLLVRFRYAGRGFKQCASNIRLEMLLFYVL